MAKQTTKTTVDDVRAFWNAGPCQADLSHAEERRQYFQEISDKRYSIREWRICLYVAKFESFRSKDVLEVGCSIATDGLEFAKNGANYVGVDLTPKAIELAKERFAACSGCQDGLKLQMPRTSYRSLTAVLIMSIVLE